MYQSRAQQKRAHSELVDKSLLLDESYQIILYWQRIIYKGIAESSCWGQSQLVETPQEKNKINTDFTLSPVFLLSFSHLPDLPLSFVGKIIQNLEIKQEEDRRSSQYHPGALFNKPSKEWFISLGAQSVVWPCSLLFIPGWGCVKLHVRLQIFCLVEIKLFLSDRNYNLGCITL